MIPLHSRTFRLALLALTALIVYTSVVLIRTEGDIAQRWAQSNLAWDFGSNEPAHLDETGIAEAITANIDVGRVTNKTLGFERIFAIGLRERTDKRDALALMAALTGFDITWIDGVKPEDIPEKAIPFGIEISAVHDNFLGSWRGHMDAIRHIVESGISSALIMEDDMDWDVHLKTQLVDFAQGARHIFPSSGFTPHSPYGDDWDLLWLGHCGEPFPEFLEENVDLQSEAKAKISAKYMITDDQTVPSYENAPGLVDWTPYKPKTRIMHLTAAPMCSFAYAISQRGARKLLHALSVNGLHMAFDNSLAQLCRDAVFDLGRDKNGDYNMQCMSVNPTLMFHHKAKGPILADSDIQSYGADGGIRVQGITESIEWSMRLNIQNLLANRPLQAQFDN